MNAVTPLLEIKGLHAGYGEVDVARAAALMDLLLRSATTRVDHRWRFWQRFSLSRDGDPNPLRRAGHGS